MHKPTNRLRELDFLRGIAIILVLFRHQPVFNSTYRMGWIGVDLFFVLSGFLVSGLLFKEFLKYGNIQPKRFLIRRGFKIYPIYYLFYIPYLFILFHDGNFKTNLFLGDMFFVQNYTSGWGYAYGASWSLAVEEHFYFGFSLLLWLGLSRKKLRLAEDGQLRVSSVPLEYIFFGMGVLCLLFRVASNLAFPTEYGRNFNMTHLRIDSLLAGVFVSYLFYFKTERLRAFYTRYKYPLFCLAILGVCWTPIHDQIHAFFVATVGLTLVYISFSILLIAFLMEEKINKSLDKVFTARIVNWVSRIGFCSYSIYIIHTFINELHRIYLANTAYDERHLNFVLTSAISVALGVFMTYKIEHFFLSIRDKYYPSRALLQPVKEAQPETRLTVLLRKGRSSLRSRFAGKK